MHRFDENQRKVTHTVVQFMYTIDSQKKYIHKIMENKSRMPFEEILAVCKDKMELIFTFLAILELLQQQAIGIQIGLGFNNFWLTKRES
jgi:segregation and condensation protein A